MSQEGISFLRDPIDSITRQQSASAIWLRGSRHAWILPAVWFVWLHVWVAHGHAEPGRFEVGAKLAPSLEQHVGKRANPEAVNAYKPGVSFGAGLRYAFLRDWLSVQAELLYATRGTDVDLRGETEGSFYFTYLELPVLARLRIPFDDGVVRPTVSSYAILGPSVSFLLDAEGVDAAGTRSLDRDGLHGLDFGVIAGLGVTWEVAPEWALSLEARFDQGFTNAFDGVDTKNQAFLLTLGVDFTLGHGDSDGDRLADYRDRCRFAAADTDQDQNRDGCPDGVKPREDDKDGDGIIGKKDECPNEAEDPNRYKDDDGCPDGHLDTDQDGLADAQDKCPEEPFSLDKNLKYDSGKYKKQEQPGCPILHIIGFNLVLDPPLEFAPGVDDVRREAQSLIWILDEVARYLEANPNIRLSVDGYADQDARGDDKVKQEMNLKESRKRAESVANYLIEEKKIDRRRLTPKGHGSTTFSTAEGKSKSRRVEFTITGGL